MSRIAPGLLLTIISLLDGVRAHTCSDGQRVQCVGVQSAANAPSTYGEGKDAVGSPLMSTNDERLFCLVDHDYHRCPEGQAPCCVDGSDPEHHGVWKKKKGKCGDKHKGILRLEASAPLEVDLKALLWKHRSALETSLTAHFGLKSVALKVISMVDNVHDRRLTAHAHTFEAQLDARGPTPAAASSDLQGRLQTALGEEIEIHSASVSWTSIGGGSGLTYWLVGGGVVLALLLACSVACFCRQRCRASKKSTDVVVEAKVVANEAKVWPEEKMEEGDATKCQEENLDDTASTATPASAPSELGA